MQQLPALPIITQFSRCWWILKTGCRTIETTLRKEGHSNTSTGYGLFRNFSEIINASRLAQLFVDTTIIMRDVGEHNDGDI